MTRENTSKKEGTEDTTIRKMARTVNIYNDLANVFRRVAIAASQLE